MSIKETFRGKNINFNNLPNCFVIGAAKSGTTSLFELIAGHPAIFASKKKELNFFSNDERYQNGVDWYAAENFAQAAGFPIRVEASPSYLAWSEKVAPRLKDLYAQRPIKLIAIFRDPVGRAYSNYWHRVRMGHEKLSFSDAIEQEDERLKLNWEKLYRTGNPLHGYFRGGCYASRLKPFLSLFPRESFFFLLQEDLQNDFDASMANLFQFLGVEGHTSVKPVVRNDSKVPRNDSLYGAYDRLKRGAAFQNRLRSLIPKGLREWVRYKLVVKPFEYPPMPADVQQFLRAKYSVEILELEKILGRDLARWKGKAATA